MGAQAVQVGRGRAELDAGDDQHVPLVAPSDEEAVEIHATAPNPELKRLELTAPIRREVSAGLDHVFSDVPVGHGYVEAQIGASTSAGPYARAEAGYHALTNLSAFGFAEANRGGLVGGAGVRLKF